MLDRVTPWLSIVGIGEDGLAGLTPAARALVDDAELFIGGERHLAMLPQDARERLAWPSPLSALLDEIDSRRGTRVCVLASGDPLWYGVGISLLRRIPRNEIAILPGRSAFSLAAARLGWSLAEVDCLTLHGRPLSLLHPYLQPGAKLLVLSENASTPAAVAGLLCERGYGASEIVVLEHLDGEKERVVEGVAADWSANDIADLNTIAVACTAGPDAMLLPRSAGLPDEQGRYEDAAAARAWLAEREGILPADIVLMGRSLGAAVMVDLAAREGTRGLILESAFTSLPRRCKSSK